MNVFVRGALSGLAATGTMTGAMFAEKEMGVLQRVAPKTITARAAQKVGLAGETMVEGAFTPTWLAAHLGYGTSCGIVFSLIRPVLPRNGILAGALYGVALWAISYLGIMPALGLYPYPTRTSTGQTVGMIAAHEVYGVTLAQINDLLD